ncbi:MAG: hypothetical protein ACRDK9_05055 [Solirubrobacterales bacterium]
MIRRRGLAGIGAALVALCALATAATAQAAAPRSFFGVVPQTPLETADLDRMGQARVGTLRFEIQWAVVDPTPAAGDSDFAGVDALVADAARNGVRVLPFIYSTPEWVARDLDGHNCRGAECFPFAPRSGPARDAWQAFVAEVVARYGPGGQFWAENPLLPKVPIEALQAWNEQNSPTFYKPKPKVKAYAKLLDASHRGVRTAGGNVDVVQGGMFGTPLGGRKPGISAWDFLDKLYDIKGAKKDFEGVAPHPYAARLKKVRAQMDLIREAIKQGRDRKVDLWVTELGWASDGPKNPLNRGPKGQANRLKQVFKFFLRKRRAWNVANVAWYSWRDNPGFTEGLCEWCPFSGLLTEDLGEKPAFRAFTRLTGGS